MTDATLAYEVCSKHNLIEKQKNYYFQLKLADGSLSDAFKYTQENDTEWRKVYHQQKDYVNKFVRESRWIDMSNPEIQLTREADISNTEEDDD